MAENRSPTAQGSALGPVKVDDRAAERRRFLAVVQHERTAHALGHLLPKVGVTPEKFAKWVLLAAERQPKLYGCSPTSIASAVLRAAELGLNPSGGLLQEGFLIPRKRSFKHPDGSWGSVLEAHFEPGYRGLLKLARRSGEITGVDCKAVHENDNFSHEFGPDGYVKHSIRSLMEPRGNVIGSYAWANTKAEGFKLVVLPHDEVEKRRAMSQATGDDSPWRKWYGEMAAKSALRSLWHLLPFATDDAGAVVLDEPEEDVDAPEPVTDAGPSDDGGIGFGDFDDVPPADETGNGAPAAAGKPPDPVTERLQERARKPRRQRAQATTEGLGAAPPNTETVAGIPATGREMPASAAPPTTPPAAGSAAPPSQPPVQPQKRTGKDILREFDEKVETVTSCFRHGDHEGMACPACAEERAAGPTAKVGAPKPPLPPTPPTPTRRAYKLPLSCPYEADRGLSIYVASEKAISWYADLLVERRENGTAELDEVPLLDQVQEIIQGRVEAKKRADESGRP